MENIKGILIYLMAVNIIAFIVYGIDKAKAIHHAWRIPEAGLILLAAAGGAAGAFLAMHVFHHKTRKPLFFIGVPVLLAMWVFLLAAYEKIT